MKTRSMLLLLSGMFLLTGISQVNISGSDSNEDGELIISDGKLLIDNSFIHGFVKTGNFEWSNFDQVSDPIPRPALVVKQGNYFRASMPANWHWTENANAVEMAAPDGVTGSSFSIAVGMFGQATPYSYLMMTLQSLDYADTRVISWQDLPSQSAFLNFVWQIGFAELSYTYQGQPVHAATTIGIIQGAGQYVAVIMAGQAPVEKWDESRHWLLRVAHSVTITNPRQVAGVDRMSLPGNIPHDYIYGEYNSAWESRGLTEDRLSQARREGMMGYELFQSPTTGEQFEMPLEAYDPTIGGYRNPNRPEEILVRPNIGSVQ